MTTKDVEKTVEKNWTELKTELETVKDDLSKLSTTVQKAYGTARHLADKQIGHFKETFESASEAFSNVFSKKVSVKIKKPAALKNVKLD